jgi:hypothetical protein
MSTPIEPGTLTSLLNEVFRGASPEQAAWIEGLAPGSSLGRYDLIREVGRGGMGVVWEARDRELGRRVAVKVIRLPENATPERRLAAEAEVAARLSHPGIVTLLDAGRNEKGAWLVNELLVGRTLAARLADGPLSLREALSLATRVAAALAYAHRNGVVHRDLSASNVFLCDDGQVKVLDLGMALAFGRRKLDGGSRGSMAPEQLSGAPEDERTDVYALGALIFRMLTGESPDGSSDAARAPARPRGIATPEAPALGTLVESMLSVNPLERPRDAGEVLTALAAIEAGLPRTPEASSRRSRARSPAAVRGAIVGAVGSALLLGAGGAALWVTRPRPTPASAIYSASAALTACKWVRTSYDPLEALPAGAEIRNGKLNGQAPVRREDRPVWLQLSDWNHLFVPVTNPPDTFAVEAWFRLPDAAAGTRMAALTAFTNPSGPDPGHSEKGRTLLVVQEPDRPASFTWGFVGGPGRTRTDLTGPLPQPISDGWHRLRLEGSRTECWVRALIDRTPLVLETGACDLDGRNVMLFGAAPYWESAGVAWRDLQVLQGDGACR